MNYFVWMQACWYDRLSLYTGGHCRCLKIVHLISVIYGILAGFCNFDISIVWKGFKLNCIFCLVINFVFMHMWILKEKFSTSGYLVADSWIQKSSVFDLSLRVHQSCWGDILGFPMCLVKMPKFHYFPTHKSHIHYCVWHAPMLCSLCTCILYWNWLTSSLFNYFWEREYCLKKVIRYCTVLYSWAL